MTNTVHTPGPWHVEPLQWDHGASIAIVANGQIIATISPENEDEEPDMFTAKRGPHDEANACVIAAAPDMFAALEEAEYGLRSAADQYHIDKGRRSSILDRQLEIVRAAIAKARGVL